MQESFIEENNDYQRQGRPYSTPQPLPCRLYIQMVTVYHGLESLEHGLKYGALFAPKLRELVEGGIKSEGQQFEITTTDSYESAFKGMHKCVEDKAKLLADRALDIPGAKKMKEHRINNIFLMAWAHLMYSSPGDTTDKFAEEVKSVHVLVSDLSPDNFGWKNYPYVLELEVKKSRIKEWILNANLVYGSIGANRIIAVHASNIAVAKTCMNQLGLESNLKQKVGA